MVVVNVDQGFRQSNAQSQLLYGSSSQNIPTIVAVNGAPVTQGDFGTPLAHADTIILQGSIVTLDGTGFNRPLTNLFTSNGLVGPLAPLSGGTSTRIRLQMPAALTTGPGTFQIINNPYAGNVVSNAVSVAVGGQLSITDVVQAGTLITVHGTGFSPFSVINLFTSHGFYGGSQAAIPITLVSATEIRFTLPAGGLSGPAYIQVLNPPISSRTRRLAAIPTGMFTIVP